MKNFKKLYLSCKSGCSNIHLIDKCLIIFMIILLSQSICTLFFNANAINDKDSIDIIIRTAISSIFGYFISANFIRKDEVENNKSYTGNPITINTSDKKNVSDKTLSVGNIGFSMEANNNAVLGKSDATTVEKPEHHIRSNSTQIIIVTAIGVIALLALILARDFIAIRPEAIPTLAQMRDIVCGCIGFLLGCPTNRTPK